MEIENPQKDSRCLISYQFWSALATNFEACSVIGKSPKPGPILIVRNDIIVGKHFSKADALGQAKQLIEKISDSKVKELVWQHFHLIEKIL